MGFFIRFYAQYKDMKATSILSLIIVMAICILACASAISGFNILLFLCFNSETAYRVVLALGGPAAAWLVFWAIAFKPFKNIN